MKRFASLLALSLSLALAGCKDGIDPIAGPRRLRDLTAANWTFAAPMLQARYRTAAATGLDGRIYVFDGNNFSIPFGLGSEAYDPATNTWSSIASAGGVFNAAIARGGDGRIYIAGSSFGSNVQAYDPVSNTYTPVASMHFARYQSAGTTGADGRVYVIGGMDISNGHAQPPEVYDPATDSWTVLPNPLDEHATPAVATGLDGRIYVFSGGSYSAPFTNTAEAYDPSTNSWSMIAPVPVNMNQGEVAVTSTDGRIYLFGSYDSGVFATPNVYVYTPATDSWSAGPSLCVGRYDPAGAADLAGHVYAIGGITAGGLTTNAVEILSGSSTTACGIALPNQPPVVVIGGPYSGAEGSPIAFDAGASSDPDGDALQFAWDFGDGSPLSDGPPNRSHVYFDNGTYTVTVTADDMHGHTTSATAQVTVSNVAPTVDPIAGATITLGQPYSLNGSFSDPSFADSYTGSVNWGDGSSSSLGAVGTPFAASHGYATAGTFTVTVTITDDDLGAGASTATVVVNPPPHTIQGLGNKVSALLGTGAISSQTAQQLMASVNAAAASLAAGNLSDARGQLGAFINKVQSCMKTGKISAADGAALIAYAQSITQ